MLWPTQFLGIVNFDKSRVIDSEIQSVMTLMGIEDLDWYREGTAKKQGLFYNRKNATYRADPRYFPKQFRGSAAVPVERRGGASRTSPPSKTKHPLLVVLATFAICAAIFVLLKIISQLLR